MVFPVFSDFIFHRALRGFLTLSGDFVFLLFCFGKQFINVIRNLFFRDGTTLNVSTHEPHLSLISKSC
ncbi:hypothetical protein LEP1GSC043_0326 [Leptospira weilii str. Ecochallenge]|uniref:Uncharacterized protein n=1 Tax=Leptospira weilii str. Ecochallenge TaxID=1049986 RepID=N1U524_9LEPT|nr:hypothetical protein LEP1GSC043_0326 [Leptospira weilii str. Ecochallenge]